MTIVAGTGIAQLIGIAAQPVLTRLYSPADYGAFSIAIGLLFILSSITSLRYEFAIALPDDNEEAANLLGLTVVVNAALSILAGLLLAFLGTGILSATGAALLASYAPLLALTQFAIGLNNSLLSWAVRTRNYTMLSMNRLNQALVLSPIQILLGWLRMGAPGLLIGAVISAFAGAARLAWGAWRSHGAFFGRISVAGMLRAAVRYRRFPIYSSPSALLAAVGGRAPSLLLVPLYGAEVGGQYFLAERLLYLPLTLVAGSVSQVFDSEGATLARERGSVGLKELFMRTTRTLGTIAILPSLLIGVTAPFATPVIFGEEWREAGVFIAVLMPMFYLMFVVTATGNVLSLLERQPLHLLREVLRLGLLAGAVLIPAALGFSAFAAVVSVSVAGCVAYAAYWVVSWRAVSAIGDPPVDAGR